MFGNVDKGQKMFENVEFLIKHCDNYLNNYNKCKKRRFKC